MSAKTVRILDIGDLQNGFLQPDGSLSIPHARKIIAPAQAFLGAVGNGIFDHIFAVMDTHFKEEYSHSDESRQFPVHCEYNTRDWELAVDVTGLPDVRYLMKNQFSMWGARPATGAVFRDFQRRAAYDRLFCFLDDPHDPHRVVPRDEYIRLISPGRNPAMLDVVLMGVASDYCNRYAMEGWLARGARVTILGDLTKGIGKETPDVLFEEQYRCYQSDRLRVVSSAEFLREYVPSA